MTLRRLAVFMAAAMLIFVLAACGEEDIRIGSNGDELHRCSGTNLYVEDEDDCPVPGGSAPTAMTVSDPDPTATSEPEPTNTSVPLAPTATAVPTHQPQETAVCRLDKIGTWSEGNNPHRIEVGGHGGQHFDFYPHPGVKAVSYVVVPPIENPDGVPSIAWGYGSMWEGDKPECASFDWVADATQYARARLDSGHSGLVVRWGTWEVLSNITDMDQDQINLVLNTHRDAFGDRAATSGDTTTEPSDTSSSSADCTATRDGDADNRVLTVPEGQTYVVEAWQPREELMVFGSGKTISGVKGSLWVYPCGTDQVVSTEQANGNHPVVQ